MNKPDDKPGPASIADLEAAVKRGDDVEIEPDGRVFMRGRAPAEPVILTRRTDLGGHY